MQKEQITLRKLYWRERRRNLALRRRVRMMEERVEEQANGLFSILNSQKQSKQRGNLSEYGFEAHHKHNDDLSIFPSQTIFAANKPDALRQAKQWLRERLAGDGFRWETKPSAYRIIVFKEDDN